ncbi:MAG: thioredoxin family protein [Aquificaceae bacterium]
MRKTIFILLVAFFVASCKKQGGTQSTEIKDLIPKHSHAMLIVESESCIYCKQLRKDLQREDISTQLQGMDVFGILYDSNAKVRYLMGGKEHVSTEEELARSLRVSSFPQVFFYDKEGNVVLHLPGYQPPKTLACTIRFVKEERYKEENYMDYLRFQKCL